MAERRDLKNRILQRGEYQKQDGRYMYKYKDANGTDRFVYSWTLTQTDRPPEGKRAGKCLRALEKEIAKDVQDNIDHTGDKLTLNDCFEKYIETKVGLKEQSISVYRNRYKRYIYETLGKRKITTIKHSDIKKFYTNLLCDKQLQATTITGLHSLLVPIFKMAIRDGYIRLNPAEDAMKEIKMADKFTDRKRHALTKEQQKAFVQYVKTSPKYHHLHSLFVTLLGTGCRIAEVLGLTWNDCDFENNVIDINHTLNYFKRPQQNKTHYEFVVTTPKNFSSVRKIPMLKEVKEALLQLKNTRIDISTTELGGYSNFIFLNKKGGLYSTQVVDASIRCVINQYNKEELQLAQRHNREPLLLPVFSAHNLRHTFCTRLCENGVNIKVVQEVMGHTNISTTMNIYNEVTQNQKQESFTQLEGKVLVY